MRVSIRDVARQAGVSHVTVANVLNGRRRKASDETYQQVLKAARELNYIPVAQPANQRRQVETRIIGLMFDALDIEDNFGASAYRGMRMAAENHKYDLLTLWRCQPLDWSEEREEIRFLDRRCDAYIFVAPVNRYKLMDTLVHHGIPVVSYAVDEVPPGAGYVSGDHQGMMRQAMEHLVERGHRRIGHLAGSPDLSFFKRRQEGFRAAMADAGLEPDHVRIAESTDYVSVANQLAQLAARGEITAVVCANDHSALVLWEQAEALGLSVPRELSIIGIDDIPAAAHCGLTTFRSANDSYLGHAAVDAAVAALGGATPWRKIEQFEMVPRISVADARIKKGPLS